MDRKTFLKFFGGAAWTARCDVTSVSGHVTFWGPPHSSPPPPPHGRPSPEKKSGGSVSDIFAKSASSKLSKSKAETVAERAASPPVISKKAEASSIGETLADKWGLFGKKNKKNAH